MLAATYAKRIGRAVAFSLAAFRQAFAGGRDLADQDTILIAGAACEMHPTALLKGNGYSFGGHGARRGDTERRAGPEWCRCRRSRSASDFLRPSLAAAAEALR